MRNIIECFPYVDRDQSMNLGRGVSLECVIEY